MLTSYSVSDVGRERSSAVETRETTRAVQIAEMQDVKASADSIE
jgi:hypothetical protein